MEAVRQLMPTMASKEAKQWLAGGLTERKGTKQGNTASKPRTKAKQTEQGITCEAKTGHNTPRHQRHKSWKFENPWKSLIASESGNNS